MCLLCCFHLHQLSFSEAMRNKARLSITGSVGENGRVLTPDCPKAVHAGHASLRHPGLAVVSSGLPWKTKNACRALMTHKRRLWRRNTHRHLHATTPSHDYSGRNSDINSETEAFLHIWIHKHGVNISPSRSHWLVLQETNEIQLWCEWSRKRIMDNKDVTLACPLESQHRFIWSRLWSQCDEMLTSPRCIPHLTWWQLVWAPTPPRPWTLWFGNKRWVDWTVNRKHNHKNWSWWW